MSIKIKSLFSLVFVFFALSVTFLYFGGPEYGGVTESSIDRVSAKKSESLFSDGDIKEESAPLQITRAEEKNREEGADGKYGELDRLRLLAIFQTHDQKVASAVVLISGIGAYRYKSGEYLNDNLQLLAILPDRVLIKDSGAVIPLYLDALSLSLGGSQPEIEPSDSQSLHLASDDSEFLSQSQRQRLAFLAHVDLHPVSEGSPAGYIVGDKFPKDASARTGIEPGDVIVSVNGYPVGDEASDILVWKTVEETGAATVLVQREGGQFVVNYPS